jgi:hypothetical protein
VPPPEGERTDTKLQTGHTCASKMPPAGSIPTPTLCTLDPWIPQPPAVGAATGGGGIHRSTASEVGRRGGSQSRLYRL